MLITEKRLRQIVSSELRRMFLSEASPAPAADIGAFINSLPKSDYKNYASTLNSLFKLKIGDLGGIVYPKVKELISQGKSHPSARAVEGAAKSEDKLNPRQKLILVLLALVTGKQAGSTDFNTIISNNVPSALGLSSNDITILLNTQGDGASGGPTLLVNLMKYLSVNPVPTETEAAPAPDKNKVQDTKTEYKMVSGDTVSGVLKKLYGIPLSSSKEAMDLYNKVWTDSKLPGAPSNAKVGQVLLLPPTLTYSGNTYTKKS